VTDSSASEPLSPIKRALYELRAARARIDDLERAQSEPIAIVGMGLRFPGGATDPASFWRLLADGRDAVTEIPSSRWDLKQFFDADPDAPGKMYARHGAFLDDVAGFDARFFGLSPREAATMDPQQRLLLEVAWEALEHANEGPEQLGGEGGVFVAMSNSDYGRMVMARRSEIDAYSSTGSNFSIAAGRLSYFLGLRGPSLVVDSACSGSLVAVHLACQSLRAEECRVALAGGVNLMLGPEIHINFSKSRMMAADGRCKTFDASADGYVRGEGCGVVVLKRLSHARADGNRILAVIRGSAVNQDGSSGGLTVPSGPAQEAVIRRALASAKLRPEDVDYVEAHGTGTSLGDPIEAHALAAVFGKERPANRPLVVGSLKTNVGHLESAAGVAGLIKTVLALRHAWIPAHLHFHAMNPHIDWQGMPVEIPTRGRPWPRGTGRRVGGVSSFGFSGTNAHVVVEAADEETEIGEPSPAVAARPTRLLALSAHTPAALDQLVDRYRGLLDRDDLNIDDVCYTASVARPHFRERAVFLGADRAALRAALDAPPTARGASDARPEIVFLFTGQGGQWAGMGRELYDTEPVFRAAMDECARLLEPLLDRPLLDVIFGMSASSIDETRYTQPAVFALQWSLAQLWKSWGIEPALVLGHSVGEYIALCVAGMWSLEHGLRIIAERGRLTHALSAGWGMSAVQCDVTQAERAIAAAAADRYVSIAAVNTRDNVVVSGRETELAQVEAILRDAGVLVTRLRISHGFHSPQMDEVADAFASFVASFPTAPPRVPVVSTVTGQWIEYQRLREAGYWRDQIRNRVEFQKAMATLASAGHDVFLEIGPAPVLTGMARQSVSDAALLVPSMLRNQDSSVQMLDSLAQLYARGAAIDWQRCMGGARPRRTELPLYPFDRQHYWLEERPEPAAVSTWESIREGAAWQASQGRLDLSVDRYARGWPALQSLTDAYIVATLATLGAFRAAGDTHSVGSLIERTGIEAGFGKLLGRWLDRLAALSLVRRSADGYVANEPIRAPAIDDLVARARDVFASDHIILDYVIACGSRLADYVTGRVSTLETLFPGGSFTRAEDLYERAPLSAYFAGIARSALDAFVRGRGASPVRIVEIGAGTGATTSALVPVVPDNGSEYHFTDLSEFFLNHAREKFARYGFMHYGIFNAEEPADAQGYADGSFDVVVATNVLHATRNVRDTLQRVRSLLAPGGILLLCEVTTYLPWFDITTALIEGWQLFEDGLRGDHPLLAAGQWTALLAEAGFERVAAFPEAGSAAEVLGQHVVIAQVPGVAPRRDARASATESRVASSSDAPAEQTSDIRMQLAAASASERGELLVAVIRAQLAKSLRVADPSTLERKRRLIDFGIDSLMAVEIRNRLASALALAEPLPATLLFEHPSIDALASYLEHDVLGYRDDPRSSLPGPTADQSIERVTELEEMSEEDAEALLLRRLQSL